VGQPGHGRLVEVAHPDGEHAEFDMGPVGQPGPARELDEKDENRDPQKAVIDEGHVHTAPLVGVAHRPKHRRLVPGDGPLTRAWTIPYCALAPTERRLFRHHWQAGPGRTAGPTAG